MARCFVIVLVLTAAISMGLYRVNKKAELYVVNIFGSWCQTCAITDPALERLDEYFKANPKVKYLVFNQTDSKTLKASEELAAKYGLSNLFEHERHTGEILFVDAHSKDVKTRFYGLGETKKYRETIEAILDGKSVESITAQYREYDLSKPNIEKIKQAKYYVIDIHHDLCGGCAITAPVFEEVAKDYLSNPKICFFTFDLTKPITVDETRALAKELGIEEIYNSYKHTGEVIFVDAKTLEIVDSLVLETDKAKYDQVITNLLN